MMIFIAAFSAMTLFLIAHEFNKRAANEILFYWLAFVAVGMVHGILTNGLP